MISTATADLLLEFILCTTKITRVLFGQIPAPQLIRNHPESGGIHIGQGEFLDGVGEAMALTDGESVMAIEEDLLFLPDNERITAAIVEEIGFKLAVLLGRERRNQTLEFGTNGQRHQVLLSCVGWG
jgi:hypothetical protein